MAALQRTSTPDDRLHSRAPYQSSRIIAPASTACWRDYSRELRHKIDAVSEKQSWRQRLSGFFHPWSIPALAGAAVVMLALTLTFGKGIWQSNDLPKDDAAMIEALPVAENLEFFKAMDVLDDLDLLESMGNQGDAA